MELDTYYKLIEELEKHRGYGVHTGVEEVAKKIGQPYDATRAIRSQYLQNPQLKFGWPAKFDDDGPFWINFYDKEKFENILTHVNNLTDDEWNKLMTIHLKKIISYNKGNAKFKK